MVEKEYFNYIAQLDSDLRDNNYPPSILVRVVFLSYLKEAFSGRRSEDYKYDPSPELTEIILKDSFNKNEDKISKKPMIILSRGPLSPLDSGIHNNILDFSPDGSERHVDQLLTSVAFQCIATNIIESEYIASIVFGMLRYFRDDIRSKGFVGINNFRMDPPDISPYSSQDGQIEGFQTNVHCQVRMYDRWTVRWKTDEELEEYRQRTGVDPRRINIPPEIVNNIVVRSNIKNG